MPPLAVAHGTNATDESMLVLTGVTPEMLVAPADHLSRDRSLVSHHD
jgi:hypothetical protein